MLSSTQVPPVQRDKAVASSEAARRNEIAAPANFMNEIEKVAKSHIPINAPQLSVERIYSSPDLTGPSPKNLSFSPDGKRVVFLQGKPEKSAQNDLWEYDISSGQKRLLVDSNLFGSDQILSEEEKSKRERLRNFDAGIVEYFWSNDGKALLVPMNGSLYYLDLQQGGSPYKLPLTSDSHPLDVKFSPQGRYISFVRDQNLFLFDLFEKKEIPITDDGKDTISNGTAEFIAEEELGRYTGYWWSPDDKRIAFVKVDESPVKIVKRSEIGADGEITTREQRYPFAGSPNVSFEIFVWNQESRKLEYSLKPMKDVYLARANWLKDGSTLALQLLSRDNKSLQLNLIDLTKKTQQPKLILQEESSTWINLHDDLRFLNNFFVWTSERSGHRHLYLYELDGSSIRTLTTGDWSVKRVVGANENEVFFEGFAQSPLEKHLYRVDLNSGYTNQVSEESGWHQAVMSSDCRYYIDTFSNIRTPPKVSLHNRDGSLVLYLEENRLNHTHPYTPFLQRHSLPTFGTLEAKDGQTLHFRLMVPAPFDLQKKYPVIVTTYGGPYFRLVTNSWDSKGYWEQMMTSLGFVIFTLDNRGSTDRGKAFENPIYRRLGEVEVEDQKAGVAYLKSLPFIDPDRIGVFGWSYGGYMTLMTMFKASEIFKTGVSVAPVTEWTQYDTAYTERYLDTPENNKEGYELSSVFPYVNKELKDRIGKLLIVHGMADDNVLFTNTVKLIRRMQDFDVPFDLMTYPGSKHAISEHSSRVHLYHKITQFFMTHLK